MAKEVGLVALTRPQCSTTAMNLAVIETTRAKCGTYRVVVAISSQRLAIVNG